MSWSRFKQHYYHNTDLGLALDISRMDFSDDFFESMESRIQKAYADMDALEKGSIANPDEDRMVGHYWLRAPELAPFEDISEEISSTLESIKFFAGKVHDGTIEGQTGAFQNCLVIGIGGSALGPQFVAEALGDPDGDQLALFFFDNTDPDGIDRTLANLGTELGQTLCVVISKSGGTPETRNGMLEAQRAYREAELDFSKHAIAITGAESKLDKVATEENWIQRFPMWDWVGGRTSELAAVGLIPAALQGLDIDSLLAGAKAMDACTRETNTAKNPAALLSLMWYYATNGVGEKDMVILPYKDRLQLFSKYLQQLIMESLGKETDLDGAVVNQGIAVYGNKGSTDQHAYIQQLREGVHNFFVTFIEVLKDRNEPELEVEPGITAGDYLKGFLLGTRKALHDNGRQSITITVNEVTPHTVGMLIALYERAVGLYASLVNINAYHQPGVEAGKKAASEVLDLQHSVVDYLNDHIGAYFTPDAISEALGNQSNTEQIFKLLEHLAANPSRGIDRNGTGTDSEFGCP
ncbi:glucose-6-phosphate isomerase [Opitutia bacterium ISCC 51]|nr:glucose-6-phosphate isomerase [Opitutae bacterium ISCC 51]QXD26590.1 glucose-6-phosphate isomerase [Opitutae bacterium ISCC 52]